MAVHKLVGVECRFGRLCRLDLHSIKKNSHLFRVRVGSVSLMYVLAPHAPFVRTLVLDQAVLGLQHHEKACYVYVHM
jgi:hypothetical protein